MTKIETPVSVAADSQKRIIGIVLVHNEDRFIERVLLNILSFCDKIHVAEHHSDDDTVSILKRLQTQYPDKIVLHHIDDPSESHDIIAPYAGQDAWVFGVDGDEIYDPAGLASLREDLLSGMYSDQWVIFGNVINCVAFDPLQKTVRGYLSPPCRSMTKLYNFAAITSWHGPCHERLHGGSITFRDGVDTHSRLLYHEMHNWDESVFRCLHVCFVQRSSVDHGSQSSRPNIADTFKQGILSKVFYAVLQKFGLYRSSKWKKDKYMRGDLVERDISSFLFSNAHNRRDI